MVTEEIKIDNIAITEEDIKNYIFTNIPNISYEEYWQIRNRYIYNGIPIKDSVDEYKRHLLIKELNRSKYKNYYMVNMINGGKKIVYMCKPLVELFYGNTGFKIIN